MYKKIELWILLVVIIFFVFIIILYGGLLRYHYYSHGQNFKFLKNLAVFTAEIPNNITSINIRKTKNNKIILENKNDILPNSLKHKSKPIFQRFLNSKRNELLILPRYDGDLRRSVVELIDINNFQVLHTYKHDITEMNTLIDTNNIEHKNNKIDKSEIRFRYRHPLILEDGGLISNGDYAPLFKIDVCSNLQWLNQKDRYHHSIMIDDEGSIFTSASLYPYSPIVENFIKDFGFYDDAIVKLDKNGNIIFVKSVVEILIENSLADNSLLSFYDPIHLNDIEPARFNSKYWKKNDLFLSLPKLNKIIIYRPSTNKVIREIQNSSAYQAQHDVDIISNKEIAFFENNNSSKDNVFSKVLVYNFETDSFSEKISKQLEEENFYTGTQGLSETLDDGSLLVEEQTHGRLIFFNNKGEKEWEFVNKDSKGNVYEISWSRIISDEKLINQIMNSIKNKEC